MPLAEGDNVELTVTFVSQDACWGTAGEAFGFVHHSGWSQDRPIPEFAVPREGQRLQVVVTHVVQAEEELPAWSTYGGRFKIDFVAAVPSVAKLDYEPVDQLIRRGRRIRAVVLVVSGIGVPLITYVAWQGIGRLIGVSDDRAPTGNELMYGCVGVLVFLGSLVFGLTAIVRGIRLFASSGGKTAPTAPRHE